MHLRRSVTGVSPNPCARHAWTLTEMLVVLVLIGVALAVTVPLYTASQRDAQLRACKANLVALYQAEEAFRMRNRRYAPSPVAGSDASVTGPWSQINEALGGAPRCPTDGVSAYTATSRGTGAAITVTIQCGKQGAHAGATDPEISAGAEMSALKYLAYSHGVFRESASTP